MAQKYTLQELTRGGFALDDLVRFELNSNFYNVGDIEAEKEKFLTKLKELIFGDLTVVESDKKLTESDIIKGIEEMRKNIEFLNSTVDRLLLRIKNHEHEN